MGYKKSHQAPVIRVRPPSPSQQASSEFRRSIKDCSTAELEYRLAQSVQQVEAGKLGIAEFSRRLAETRTQLNARQREHDVLVAEIENHRK